MGSAVLSRIEVVVHFFDSRDSKCVHTCVLTSAFLFHWHTVLESVDYSVIGAALWKPVALPFAPMANEIPCNSWEFTEQVLKQFSQAGVSEACSTRYLMLSLGSDRLDKNGVAVSRRLAYKGSQRTWEDVEIFVGSNGCVDLLGN